MRSEGLQLGRLFFRFPPSRKNRVRTDILYRTLRTRTRTPTRAVHYMSVPSRRYFAPQVHFSKTCPEAQVLQFLFPGLNVGGETTVVFLFLLLLLLFFYTFCTLKLCSLCTSISIAMAASFRARFPFQSVPATTHAPEVSHGQMTARIRRILVDFAFFPKNLCPLRLQKAQSCFV